MPFAVEKKKKLNAVNHSEPFIFFTQEISFSCSNNAHKF